MILRVSSYRNEEFFFFANRPFVDLHVELHFFTGGDQIPFFSRKTASGKTIVCPHSIPSYFFPARGRGSANHA